MSIDINLVKIASESSKDLRLRKIKTISFVILFIVGLSSVILFLINFRFSANYVRNQQDELTGSLSAHEEISTKIFLLNERLSDVSQILSDRKKYHEKADKVIEKIPPTVVVQEFQINEGGISMEVSSNSLLELNNFLNEILALSTSKTLSGVSLDGLTFSKTVFVLKLKAI